MLCIHQEAGSGRKARGPGAESGRQARGPGAESGRKPRGHFLPAKQVHHLPTLPSFPRPPITQVAFSGTRS
eukprot:5252958-Pyramimonas_sp.AAC.1